LPCDKMSVSGLSNYILDNSFYELVVESLTAKISGDKRETLGRSQ
jgi:hypothetical protein